MPAWSLFFIGWNPQAEALARSIYLYLNSVRLCYGPLALNYLHEIKVVLLSLTGQHQSPSCRLWPTRDPQREQTLGRRGGQLPVQRRRLQHQRAQAEAQGWPEVAGNDHPPEADLRSRHQDWLVSEVSEKCLSFVDKWKSQSASDRKYQLEHFKSITDYFSDLMFDHGCLDSIDSLTWISLSWLGQWL